MSTTVLNIIFYFSASYYNPESSKTLYSAPPVVNPYNFLQNTLPPLHDIFPQNWTEHVSFQ